MRLLRQAKYNKMFIKVRLKKAGKFGSYIWTCHMVQNGEKCNFLMDFPELMESGTFASKQTLRTLGQQTKKHFPEQLFKEIYSVAKSMNT